MNVEQELQMLRDEIERLKRNEQRFENMWQAFMKYQIGIDTYYKVTELLEELERDEQ